MRLLLDTNTALWMFAGSAEISPDLEEDLTDPANDVYFSDVSAWEIVIKHSIGKLALPQSPENFIASMVSGHQLSRLPIAFSAIVHWGSLPMIHRDPFDRLLVAQAVQEGLTLVASDPQIRKYPVPTLWK